MLFKKLFLLLLTNRLKETTESRACKKIKYPQRSSNLMKVTGFKGKQQKQYIKPDFKKSHVMTKYSQAIYRLFFNFLSVLNPL